MNGTNISPVRTQVDDTVANGATENAASSNWAYDHAADYDLHTKVVRKTADVTISSDNSLNNDAELYFALAANEVWFIEVVIYCIGKAAEDISLKLTAPSGAVGTLASYIIDASIPAGDASFDITQNVALDDDTLSIIRLKALIINSTTAGNFQLQWCQQTSGATDLTVKANSFIRATQLV